MKVKISPRVLDFLDGTGVGQEIRLLDHPGQLTDEHLATPADEWDLAMLILKTKAVTPRSDGSLWPDLTQPEVEELREYADYFIHASEGVANMDGLGDLNAARAQVRRCDDALQRFKWKEEREWSRA